MRARTAPTAKLMPLSMRPDVGNQPCAPLILAGHDARSRVGLRC
jgi:hypothetical protein